MSQRTQESEDAELENRVGALLRVGGRREELPTDLREKWERHTRIELAALLESRKKQAATKKRRYFAMAASLAFVALSTWFYVLPVTDVDESATLAYSSGSFTVYHDAHSIDLAPGESVPDGSLVQTNSRAFVGIRYGQHDLRIGDRTKVRISSNELNLQVGKLFVSNSDAASSATSGQSSVSVRTPNGVVRDIGTQFIVETDGSDTVAIVRKGVIKINSEDVDTVLESAEGSAQKATLKSGEPVMVESTLPRGDSWDWIYRGSAGFSVNGKSAKEFLEWASNEMGTDLTFDSEDTALLAEFSQLQGNAIVADPEKSLSIVLASVDLRAAVLETGDLYVERATSSP